MVEIENSNRALIIEKLSVFKGKGLLEDAEAKKILDMVDSNLAENPDCPFVLTIANLLKPEFGMREQITKLIEMSSEE